MLNNEAPLVHFTSLSWESYIKQCSLRNSQKIEALFKEYFLDKIVVWSGVVTVIHREYVQIHPVPLQPNERAYQIRLNMKPELLGTYRYPFVVGTELPFQGILRSIGLLFTLNSICYFVFSLDELDLLPLNPHQPHLGVSFAAFHSLFSPEVFSLSDTSFQSVWKNKFMCLTGTFGNSQKA